MPKTAIYARVSTDKQTEANQLLALTQWANSRGWEIHEVYQEADTSWKAGHQKELARLKTDAQHRKFDTVLVWALDRMSREGALVTLSLVDQLKAYGCRLISYQEPWTEAPGAAGEVMYAIAGWVAKMESQRRSERTKAGLARLKAQGKTLGRPKGSVDRKRRKRRNYYVNH
ncbi:recombinase family protein [Dehalococcoides mccartyi]|uniref:Probable site-specific recombinase / resolvase,fragment n=1 Tax=Dehalococcoides mccartyi (strain CBDB1) TaxID=255470 RepID=A0A916KMC2_DEHMC|nr:recombinase family protein [Dehalococcoides mccartyi]CAI82871.1 probable site-specific recombinase / resolvase,fragment [Dehalococcoides mccartyi CBDB1]